ncbi:hypothetical protein [uncultured Psychroserpens sp.]|uniref:hypothetical protein n=1 Tax=uncultured Psychroserpens sp. TaxID=255436 RepID=UPI002637751B|nr:hypothetical protein [uncultured Psychroserpens sp.]
MKTRWYYSILTVMFVLLAGFATKEHCAVPNQEIVLQFTNDAITSNDAKNTISIVKQQLQSVGVENIQVKEQQGGHLKITYYSDSDVDSIKAVLSEVNLLELGYLSDQNGDPQIPSDDRSLSYNLDVYEIQQADDASDLGGKLALETKAEQDRFYNPNLFVPQKNVDEKELCKSVEVAYKFNRTVAIAIDNSSRKIPEVRAGPSHFGTCFHTIS